jgi:hypothetical protein
MPNLVITRTFSKIYGLAGLRIGYALTSAEIADLMNRVRQPFNCNNLALAAAAAALDDHQFVATSYALNRGHGADRRRAEAAGLHAHSLARQLRDLQSRRRGAGQPEAAQAGRDRSPDRRLRHAGMAARDDRYRKRNARFLAALEGSL